MVKYLLLFVILFPSWLPLEGAAPKRKLGASQSVAKARGGKAKRTKHGRVTARSGSRGQRSPTAARYREIQQALADRGYLKAEPNGVWDASSVDALKRFQQDRNLRASGKLDPASLISLGLGPSNQGVLNPPATAQP